MTEEIDPLDAFMKGIEQEIQTNGTGENKRRDEFEEEEEEEEIESFMKIQEREEEEREKEKKRRKKERKEETDSDSEEEVYRAAKEAEEEQEKKRKEKEKLEEIDHSKIKYEEIKKDFLGGTKWEREGRKEEEVKEERKKRGIEVRGEGESEGEKVKIMTEFSEMDETGKTWKQIREVIEEEEGMIEPFSIQCQVIPAILKGRDVIGIGKTGSGKTIGFVAPMIVHVEAQRKVEKGEGAIGLIIEPTRELVHQIYKEVEKYSNSRRRIGMLKVKVVEIQGGVSKYEQTQELQKSQCSVIVATPGRLIEQIQKKGTNLRRCTYFVIDEADRMLDFGFEDQIRMITGQIRPQRQTLMFSATMRRREERLARDILENPVIIQVGGREGVNEDVEQQVIVIDGRRRRRIIRGEEKEEKEKEEEEEEEEKMKWMKKNVSEMKKRGSVLVFVNQKARTEEIARKLNEEDFEEEEEMLEDGRRRIKAAALHGDIEQAERQRIMFAFKNGDLKIVVATDIASRGLDIGAVKTVVNFENGKNISTHIHRIGRTGRGGARDGIAITFVTRKEIQFACELVRILEQTKQRIPSELVDVAFQNSHFKRQWQHKQQQQQQQQEKQIQRREGVDEQIITSIPPSSHPSFHSIPSSKYQGSGKHRGIGFVTDVKTTTTQSHSLSTFQRASDETTTELTTFIPKSSQPPSPPPPQQQQQKSISVEEGRAMALAWAAKYCPH